MAVQGWATDKGRCRKVASQNNMPSPEAIKDTHNHVLSIQEFMVPSPTDNSSPAILKRIWAAVIEPIIPATGNHVRIKIGQRINVALR